MASADPSTPNNNVNRPSLLTVPQGSLTSFPRGSGSLTGTGQKLINTNSSMATILSLLQPLAEDPNKPPVGGGAGQSPTSQASPSRLEKFTWKQARLMINYHVNNLHTNLFLISQMKKDGGEPLTDFFSSEKSKNKDLNQQDYFGFEDPLDDFDLNGFIDQSAQAFEEFREAQNKIRRDFLDTGTQKYCDDDDLTKELKNIEGGFFTESVSELFAVDKYDLSF